MNEFIKNSK